MLDLNKVRENVEQYKITCKAKLKNIDVDKILSLDDERKNLQKIIDDLKFQQRQLAEKKEYEQAKELKNEIQIKESEAEKIASELNPLLLDMPNFMHPNVKIGYSEDENEVAKTYKEPTQFDFEPRDHEDIGKLHGRIDKDTASEVSGSRFGYIKGELVFLQMAIVNFVLTSLSNREIIQKIIKEKNLNIKASPFVPVLPPLMMKMDVMEKMGRLHPMDERYCLYEDKMVLNGSAEHTLGSMFMDHIFKEEELPIRYIGYATSFRREAGTYGKDTKGILRMHQFDKLEMESFCLPEHGEDEQELFIGLQEYLTQQLDLPYQVISKCSADIGSVDYRGVDIETRMPGQNKYRETHTSDWMSDFQSRRLNTRVERFDKKKEYVHMNDATAFALGRIMIAIIENYQTKEGYVRIPKVLQPFMGKEIMGK